MHTFKDIEPGDMYNTKIARWVKVDDNSAVVVMSGVLEIGEIKQVKPDAEIIILWSNKLDLEREATELCESPICGCFTRASLPLAKMLMRKAPPLVGS